MNTSYSKIRHIQESNRLLEQRILNEQIASNVGQLVKDIVGFIFDMNIIPGPIDGAKLLYDLYNEKDTVQTIKKFVRSRIFFISNKETYSAAISNRRNIFKTINRSSFN